MGSPSCSRAGPRQWPGPWSFPQPSERLIVYPCASTLLVSGQDVIKSHCIIIIQRRRGFAHAWTRTYAYKALQMNSTVHRSDFSIMYLVYTEHCMSGPAAVYCIMYLVYTE